LRIYDSRFISRKGRKDSNERNAANLLPRGIRGFVA